MNKMNLKAMNVYVLKYWDDEDNRWEIDKVTSNNEEALKWDSRGHDYCYNGYAIEVEELDQLTKAKDLLKKMYYLYHDPCVTNKDLENKDKLFAETEQFLKEIEK